MSFPERRIAYIAREPCATRSRTGRSASSDTRCTAARAYHAGTGSVPQSGQMPGISSALTLSATKPAASAAPCTCSAAMMNSAALASMARSARRVSTSPVPRARRASPRGSRQCFARHRRGNLSGLRSRCTGTRAFPAKSAWVTSLRLESAACPVRPTGQSRSPWAAPGSVSKARLLCIHQHGEELHVITQGRTDTELAQARRPFCEHGAALRQSHARYGSRARVSIWPGSRTR